MTTNSMKELNNTKLDVLNSKFTTSILTETVNKLTLIHFGEDNDTNTVTKDENKDITNPDDIRFGTNVNNIKRVLKQVICQLNIDQSFTDFSGKSLAENESQFLDDYNRNKTILAELCSTLQMFKDLSNRSNSEEAIDEILIKSAMRCRLNKNWENTRRKEQSHWYRLMIGDLQDEINEYEKLISSEERCILDIETFSLAEMEIHKSEFVRWMEKFDEDLNKTELDIQMAVAAVENMKTAYELTVENIKRRIQEMKDFIALKIERVEQKNSVDNKLIEEYRDHLMKNKYLFP